MSVIASTKLWRPLAISAALVFVYGVVLAKLGHDWWTDENYSHGLLIPFIIGYIVWTQREHFTRDEARPGTILGGALILLALLMLFAGTAGAELFMQRISLVVMLSGLVIFFWGHRLLNLLWVPIGLLVLAIPIPAIIFN
jgi:exosortase